jgi:hypothetical protein
MHAWGRFLRTKSFSSINLQHANYHLLSVYTYLIASFSSIYKRETTSLLPVDSLLFHFCSHDLRFFNITFLVLKKFHFCSIVIHVNLIYMSLQLIGWLHVTLFYSCKYIFIINKGLIYLWYSYNIRLMNLIFDL